MTSRLPFQFISEQGCAHRVHTVCTRCTLCTLEAPSRCAMCALRRHFRYAWVSLLPIHWNRAFSWEVEKFSWKRQSFLELNCAHFSCRCLPIIQDTHMNSCRRDWLERIRKLTIQYQFKSALFSWRPPTGRYLGPCPHWRLQLLGRVNFHYFDWGRHILILCFVQSVMPCQSDEKEMQRPGSPNLVTSTKPLRNDGTGYDNPECRNSAHSIRRRRGVSS